MSPSSKRNRNNQSEDNARKARTAAFIAANREQFNRAVRESLSDQIVLDMGELLAENDAELNIGLKNLIKEYIN